MYFKGNMRGGDRVGVSRTRQWEGMKMRRGRNLHWGLIFKPPNPVPPKTKSIGLHPSGGEAHTTRHQVRKDRMEDEPTVIDVGFKLRRVHSHAAY